MAGFIPATHVFERQSKQDVDARHKAGHDDKDWLSTRLNLIPRSGHAGKFTLPA
jgi:hypothetical protein